MSTAFDTSYRQLVLLILDKIINEDELRVVQFLLSNTKINTRIEKADIQVPLKSIVATRGL